MTERKKHADRHLDVKQIQDYLEKNDLTDTQFAAKIGCHYNSVRRMLKGYVPSVDMLESLAKAMSVADPWSLLK